MKRLFFRNWFLVVFLLLFMSACNAPVQKQENAPQAELALKFNKDKKFKIAQFTDIHWRNENEEQCAKSEEVIRYILEVEKPDLAVLSGDVVNYPAIGGWERVISFFTDAGVNFAVTMGNHDHESEWTHEQIYEFLANKPGFIGEIGPEEISGEGNYIITLQSADSDEVKALLYFLDSNSYAPDKTVSDYDWIKFDQVAWYREQSQKYTAKNGGKPYPALAFFHIPLPEYYEVVGKPTTIGESDERICSPEINTGMFASMWEMQDVMGTFVGHDHNNNFIGIYNGIALAYGQSSGYGGYGDMKGSRIIELEEGKYGFNTWIRTLEGTSLHYNFPFGYSFLTDENQQYLPAKNIENRERGLKYRYYEGNFSSVADYASLQPKKEGEVANFSLDMADTDNYFGVEFNGLIEIPETGMYRFFAFSDDGSQLFIDGKLVIDNDGKHGLIKKDALLALDKGFHELKVLYFQHTGSKKVEISYTSLNQPEMLLPASALFYERN